MKVRIIGGDADYDELFRSFGHSLVGDVHYADLVCFTGGEDVSPKLYGDNKHPYTYNNIVRDVDEADLYKIALSKQIPMVGICRGGQFLNVMNGGRMYQHVSGHTADHEITDATTGEIVLVSSTHHQMMMMSSEGVLVASSTIGGTREWYDGQIARRDVSELDTEVVFYDRTRCLCFQPHPEFRADRYLPMKQYFKTLLEKYLNVK